MKLYGKNPVAERLKAHPRSIRTLYIETGKKDLSFLGKKARRLRIPVVAVPPLKMAKISQSRNSQGVVADVEDFAYVEYETMLARAIEKKETIIFLDNLNDPQNLGALMRSLACLGGFCIVLPTRNSVAVTEAVLRVASGGDNYVPVARVPNLSNAINAAKARGVWIAGGVVSEGDNIMRTTLPFPLALVVGSEQKGIREGVRKQIDVALTIPMPNARLSFNAAHATTIFCYEIAWQRRANVQRHKQSKRSE